MIDMWWQIVLDACTFLHHRRAIMCATQSNHSSRTWDERQIYYCSKSNISPAQQTATRTNITARVWHQQITQSFINHRRHSWIWTITSFSAIRNMVAPLSAGIQSNWHTFHFAVVYGVNAVCDSDDDDGDYFIIPCCGCCRCHWSDRMRWGWHKFSTHSAAMRMPKEMYRPMPFCPHCQWAIKSKPPNRRLGWSPVAKRWLRIYTSNATRPDAVANYMDDGVLQLLYIGKRASTWLTGHRFSFAPLDKRSSASAAIASHIYTACTLAASEY